MIRHGLSIDRSGATVNVPGGLWRILKKDFSRVSSGHVPSMSILHKQGPAIPNSDGTSKRLTGFTWSWNALRPAYLQSMKALQPPLDVSKV